MFKKIFWFLFCIWIGNCAPAPFQDAVAEKGVLDLRNVSMNRVISLRGEWGFYWNMLLLPEEIQKKTPDFYIGPGKLWSRVKGESIQPESMGVATYHLKILLPEKEEQEVYALHIQQPAGSAVRVFIDDREILELGKVGTSKSTMEATRNSDMVFFSPTWKSLEITIQMSNFHYAEGAIWYPPVFGKSSVLEKVRTKEILVDSLFLGSILLSALLHLIVFLFTKENISYLYFSLFSIFFGLHGISIHSEILSVYLPELPYAFHYFLSMGFNFAIPMFFLYIQNLIPGVVRKKLLNLILLVYAIICIGIAFFPPGISSGYTHSIIILNLIILVILFLELVFDRSPQKKFSRLASLPLFLYIIFAFLEYTTVFFGIFNIRFLKFSYINFIIFQAFINAHHFAVTFTEKKNLSKTLKDWNIHLEKKLEEVTGSLREEKDRAIIQNQWKSRFVEIVSHDLKSPLSSLLFYWDNMEMNTDSFSTVKEKTISLLQQMILIVKYLLSDQNLSRSKLEPEFDDFSVLDLFGELNDQITFDRSLKNIYVNINIPEDLILTADRILCSVLFRNLLSNSLRHSPPNSTIEISSHETSSYQIISISDQGPGFSEPVWKEWNQLDSDKNDLNQNYFYLGLGLKTAKFIMNLHKGEIHLRNIPNSGMKVDLYFPNNRHTIYFYGKDILYNPIKELCETEKILLLKASSMNEIRQYLEKNFADLVVLEYNIELEKNFIIWKGLIREWNQKGVRFLFFKEDPIPDDRFDGFPAIQACLSRIDELIQTIKEIFSSENKKTA
ncbi:MAG: sensor histidine kinase [Leptospiraceae bacterium]|nr:sensor histidine kinase [Leptospiraceae bacterium]MCP5513806.1 sensor histidine kinase [Leptospiraceae bacterium]